MQHLFLTAFMLSAFASLWAVRLGGRIKHLSISLHVAQTTRMQVVFGSTLALATILMTITFFAWLLPKYDVGILSYLMFALVILCLGTIAFVPHVINTWREPVHNIGAWGFVYVIIVTMVVMLCWPLSSLARWTGLGLTVVNATLLLLALTQKQLRQWFLYFQMAYLGVFFSFILVTVYL